MTKYISSRDASAVVGGDRAVLDCFASDGGLYVPQTLPILSYKDMLDLDYVGRADKVLRAFFDFDVGGIAEKAFADFDDPAPTVKIDDNAFIVELWHGKACSSKDMALCVLPMLIERAKAKLNISSDTIIPFAASDETGVAVAQAFAGVKGTEAIIFYSRDELSELNKRELAAVKDSNVCAVGVTASYDLIRFAVKSAYSDVGLTAALKENNKFSADVSSANIGIIVPQIAYFFSAYCDLVNSDEIKAGDKIDFVLPIDDFGGIIAGYYAAQIGLPINKLVTAGTKHAAFIDFIDSGEYDTNGAIDTLPYDLERLLFALSGNNAELTAARMNELNTVGRFSVTESEMGALRLFAGSNTGDADIKNAIADMFDEYGYTVDVRTAAACFAALKREFVRPTAVLSVADPYRSAKAVLSALGEKPPMDIEQQFRHMEEITACEPTEALVNALSAKPSDNAIPLSDIAKFLSEKYCKK
ncbi:MAG: hypothetical protein J1F69_00525 [Clostridiales bacterium]|nr:hypothetical protein [Clostridiales bacterium]